MLFADKYRLLEKIGKGGMAEVYLAEDTRLKKLWAVKMIDKDSGEPHQAESIKRESSILKKLDHPALPRIVDILEDDRRIMIVMDHIRGTSVEQIVKRYGPIPEKKALEWALVICDTLIYLHSREPPVIYRDMKPSNLMLTPEGRIRIIDFGIACEYRKESRDTEALGTRGYAPPEQYKGQADERSDIYSFGMTLFYILTGEDPVYIDSNMPVRAYNKSISEGMEAVIEKCIQPVIGSRYQNCRELMTDLRYPDRVTEKYIKTIKRHAAAFFALSAAAAFLFAAGIFCIQRDSALKNKSYMSNIGISTAAGFDERMDGCEEAVREFPGRPGAYLKMLEIIEEKGIFTREDSDRFIRLYSAGKDLFDAKDGDTVKLNLKAGEMYMSMYEDEDINTRILKAYSFFEENHNNTSCLQETEEKIMSEGYYTICRFYKNYIFNTSSVKEASKAEYREFFEEMKRTVKMKEESSFSTEYDSLLTYNTVFMLLFDQRFGLINADISGEEILQLMDHIAKRAGEMRVSRTPSENLKREIEENYIQYRAAVESAVKQKER